jgi:lysine-specific demethylase/histidyl-hydroxylase NO66
VQERKDFNYNEDLDFTNNVVDPTLVWTRYHKQGCSIRLLHPQQHCDQVANALAKLEELFSCVAGCNVYLTPPGSKVGRASLALFLEAMVCVAESNY